MRPVAIFRFSPTEGPAGFADWLTARGLPWKLVPLDAGEAVPTDVAGWSGIGMMGGPMSVNDDLPWVAPLCRLLRTAVARGVPVIGHCLGGQLLAKAMGASVRPAVTPELGWIDVTTNDAGARRAWFGDRDTFTTFEWHDETFALPPGAKRVLTNSYNVEQGFLLDDRHLGLQCHLEMTAELLKSWLASSAGELPAVSLPERQSAAEVRRDLPQRLARLHAVADDVYARWTQGLAP